MHICLIFIQHMAPLSVTKRFQVRFACPISPDSASPKEQRDCGRIDAESRQLIRAGYCPGFAGTVPESATAASPGFDPNCPGILIHNV
jgi:hypothetical protein